MGRSGPRCRRWRDRCTRRPSSAGDLRGEALAQRFREADLFVLPGTGGLAVQQAMSYALPVLVAEADGTQADLVRERNGRVLPPGDEDALVAALQASAFEPGPAAADGRGIVPDCGGRDQSGAHGAGVCRGDCQCFMKVNVNSGNAIKTLTRAVIARRDLSRRER